MAPQVELGPFVLDERIGKGGMGDVWRGRHRTEGTLVAIKVITPRWAREPRYAEALWREVEASARLDHRGIVSVLELGEIPYSAASETFGAFREGSPYFVMEYVPAGSLSYRRRPWSESRAILRAVLDALAHAHARRVVHRDIKPTNILLDEDGRPRLTDFGLAHVVGGRTPGPEEMSGASGTPRYMAPEQIVGDWREQGPWTDLYAVGCLAFGLVTGAPPYDGPVDEVLHAHINEPPPSVGDAAPPGFDGWLRLMMAKAPRRRYRRAADALWGLIQLDETHETALDPPPAVLAPDAFMTLSALTQPRLPSPPSSVSDAAAPDELRTTSELRVARPIVPPMPATFSGYDAAVPLEVPGVGVGIFGMRTVPLVGRRAEREVIWEELHEVRSSGRPRAVVLRGEAGTGKSRLAEWIGERAHELGAGTLLRVVHGPSQGAHDGLAPMITDALRLHGLSPAETRERVCEFWFAHGADRTELFWCDAITRIVLGDNAEGLPRVKFSSAMQRWAAVTELLGRLADDRPVILWLDDVQWGADALGLCRYALDRADGRPLLFVLTVRDEAVVQGTSEALRLEGVASHAASTTIRVGPLPDSQRMQLVRSMLGLDSDAARTVAERAGGNPLFAVQLVGDLIERDALELRPGGFGLRGGVELDVPDDIHELWRRRVAHTLTTLPRGADPVNLQAALELAAALGQEVDDAEWHAVSGALDRGMMRDLVAALVAHRLAARTPRGWAFTHGMLRESLERTARIHGRWAQWNSSCADALAERSSPPDSFHRVSGHLLAAERWADALTPLHQAALLGFDLGDYDAGLAALDRMRDATNAAGLPDSHGWRARRLTLRARILRERSDLRGASACLDEAEPIARALGATRVLAELLGTRASLATLSGDLDRARELIEESLLIWRDTDDHAGLGHALRTRNWLMFWSGDYEGARAALEEAESAYQRSGDEDGLGWVRYEQAAIALHGEQIDRAAELTASAAVQFEAVGNVVALADCANMQGEIARMRGELELAQSLYREALQIYEPMGHANIIVARENLALTLLASGDAAAAFPILTEVLRTTKAAGRTPFALRLTAELLECVAALDDEEAWEAHYDGFEEIAAATTFADHDTASALERAGATWAGRSDTGRALRAWGDARALWTQLQRDDRCSEIDARIAAITESPP